MRAGIRGAFTRVHTAIKAELEKENPQIREVQVNFAVLRDKAAELERLDNIVLDLIFCSGGFVGPGYKCRDRTR